MATTQARIDYDALVKEDRVHGSVYADPQIFADEMEKIFHRGWVYVGHAGEVPEPGDFRLKKIGQQSVIMVRGEDGQVRLLMNRCRHRANTVCQTERGNAKMFRCAYHGWTYRNNGDLSAVTYQDGYDESFRKEDYGLSPVPRMDMYRGFIFGSLSPAGITLDEYLGQPVKEQLDLFVDLSPEGELDVTAGVHKYGYRGNWKFQLENGMDGYHPNFVHQTFFTAVQKRTGMKLDLFTSHSTGLTRDLGNGHVMLDSREYNKTNSHLLRAALPTTPGGQDYREAMLQRYGRERAEEILIAGGTHMLVFPNLILIGVQIRVVQPISTDETQVFLYPTLLKGVAPGMNVARLRGHESFFGPAGKGAVDDLEMFERNQAGLSARVDPWLLLARGRQRERRDGDGTIVAQMTDEVTQRGIWRQWKKMMVQGVESSARRQMRAGGRASQAAR
ncbi:MAG TPA: aromatic ring-hydroxylating dioxygenase subunit alpha [Candidatus Binatia bacterium]|jgi:phenylpropionate dioxygenase-like ring-hydroxylating dioxygenase large terminal subunit|nr:aromatic ring-hydroxylating dioxygenase subunit alpha [Candidatus Binatia bacterium]